MSGVVARELKQRAAFASPEQEVLLGLRLAAARVVEPWEAFLKANADLTPNQYNVLRILRGAGTEGLPTLEIAGRMIEQAPGVTRLLDRLQAKALVRRQRSAEDRRQIRCWITPAGLDLLQRLEAAMQEGGHTFMAPLSPTDLATFIRLLDALRAGTSAPSRPSTDVPATRTSRVPVPQTRR